MARQGYHANSSVAGDWEKNRTDLARGSRREKEKAWNFGKTKEREDVAGIAGGVTTKALAICTRSLAGNLSLRSVVPNVRSLFFGTAKADAMNEEWN